MIISIIIIFIIFILFITLVFQAILTVAKEVKSIIKIQATVRGYLGEHITSYRSFHTSFIFFI